MIYRYLNIFIYESFQYDRSKVFKVKNSDSLPKLYSVSTEPTVKQILYPLYLYIRGKSELSGVDTFSILVAES